MLAIVVASYDQTGLIAQLLYGRRAHYETVRRRGNARVGDARSGRGDRLSGATRRERRDMPSALSGDDARSPARSSRTARCARGPGPQPVRQGKQEPRRLDMPNEAAG